MSCHFCSFFFSSTERLTNVTSLSCSSFSSSFKKGISCLQGAHQVAHTSTNTNLPFRSLKETILPFWSAKLKSTPLPPGPEVYNFLPTSFHFAVNDGED